jgi:hypothetical protein
LGGNGLGSAGLAERLEATKGGSKELREWGALGTVATVVNDRDKPVWLFVGFWDGPPTMVVEREPPQMGLA